jgi:hypothetical protein
LAAITIDYILATQGEPFQRINNGKHLMTPSIQRNEYPKSKPLSGAK